MADNTTFQSSTPATAPDGLTVTMNELADGSKAQEIQLLTSDATGADDRVPASAASGLLVEVSNPGDIGPSGGVLVEVVNVGSALASQAQTSTGLTTSSVVYSAGDQLGEILTFTSMASVSGGTGRIRGARLVDAADVMGDVDLFLFSTSVTLAADNVAGPGTSDADTLNCVGVIQLPPAIDVGGARVSSVSSIDVPYVCGATSLFVAMVTRTGHTFFGAATDLNLRLFYET